MQSTPASGRNYLTIRTFGVEYNQPVVEHKLSDPFIVELEYMEYILKAATT
jgi:hypothetical protein